MGAGRCVGGCGHALPRRLLISHCQGSDSCFQGALCHFQYHANDAKLLPACRRIVCRDMDLRRRNGRETGLRKAEFLRDCDMSNMSSACRTPIPQGWPGDARFTMQWACFSGENRGRGGMWERDPATPARERASSLRGGGGRKHPTHRGSGTNGIPKGGQSGDPSGGHC